MFLLLFSVMVIVFAATDINVLIKNFELTMITKLPTISRFSFAFTFLMARKQALILIGSIPVN